MAKTDLSRSEELPRDPKRVRAFASFFKNYMSLSSFVTAALPIPVTALQLIPTFAVQTRALSVYTPLFCFLVLAYIFYQRHNLARLIFWDSLWPGRRVPLEARLIGALPALLILLSVLTVIVYNLMLNWAIEGCGWSDANVTSALEYTDLALAKCRLNRSDGMALMAAYLGIFVFAEAAFVLMAVKEYLQDLVKLSDVDVILGHRQPDARPASTPDSDETSRSSSD